jgi:hypothetical protein
LIRNHGALECYSILLEISERQKCPNDPRKEKNRKYLQITYKVRGCHKLNILLATPSSSVSLLLCQKMSEIHSVEERDPPLQTSLKSLHQVARFLPYPKFEPNFFSNTHDTQPELL